MSVNTPTYCASSSLLQAISRLKRESTILWTHVRLFERKTPLNRSQKVGVFIDIYIFTFSIFTVLITLYQHL